jgi:acetyl esterase
MDTPSHRLFANGFLLDAVPSTGSSTTTSTAATAATGASPRCWPTTWTAWRRPACCLAECDPLVDEGLAYADRLRMAGVPVDLELVRGMTHDFIKMGRALPRPASPGGAADALRAAWKDNPP